MAWHWRALKWVGFGSLGFALLVVLAVGGGLLWGMAAYSRAHPLDLMPYMPRLQAVLKAYGVQLDVGSAVLYVDDSPVVKVADLTLRGADGQLAVVAEQVAVKLANRRLFLLQLSPKIIEGEGVTFRLVNTTKGVTLAGLGARGADEPAAPASGHGALEWLNTLSGSGMWGRLKKVGIDRFTLLADDHVTHAAWVLEGGRLQMSRYPDDGERATLTGQVRRLNGTPDQQAVVPVLMTFDHAAGDEKATLRGRLDQADVDMVADYLPPQLKDLLKARGEVELGTDLLPGNQLGRPWVTLRLGHVDILPPKGFSKPFQFEKLTVTASYVPPVEGDSRTDVLTLHAVDAVTDRGVTVLASGTVAGLTTDPSISLHLSSPQGDVQGVFDFFPDQEKGFDHALKWLRPNIVSATYSNLRGHYYGKPSAFPGCGDACGDIVLDADILGGAVHFLPHMSPAVLVSPGTFAWRGQQFTVATPVAKVGTQLARDVSVTLTHLFLPTATHVLVASTLSGELADVMKELHTQDAAVPTDMTGRQASHMEIDVPIPLGDVQPDFAMSTVLVSGTVTNATVRGVEGLDADTFRAPLAVVTLDAAKNLRVQGKGQLVAPGGKTLADAKADVVVNIQPGVKTATRIGIDGTMDGQGLLKRLDVTQGVSLTGPVAVVANLVQQPSGTVAFDVQADATMARVALPDMNFTKPAKEALVVSARGVKQGADHLVLEQVKATGRRVRVNGRVDVASSRMDDMRVDLPAVQLGETRVSVNVADRKAVLKGDVLDLRGMDLFGDDDGEARIKNMALQLDMGTLLTRTARLTGVHGTLKASKGVWDVSAFQARVDGGGKVALTTKGLGNGRRKVTINMDNAGAVLGGLGLYENLKNGKLWGDITYDTPTTATGLLKMQDFELKNPPVLMSLLGLLSLQQLVAGTDSTLFDHAEIPLAIKGDEVTLTKAVLDGPSMSIRLDGTYDRAQHDMNIDGRLAPAIPLNRLVTKIPLVGTILAGSQNGVVVADFKVKGPSSKPDIHVRPLSVLTPGLVKDFWRGLTDVVTDVVTPSPTVDTPRKPLKKRD